MVAKSIALYIKTAEIDITSLNAICAKLNKLYLLYNDESFSFDSTLLKANIVVLREIGRSHNSIYFSLVGNALKYLVISLY